MNEWRVSQALRRRARELRNAPTAAESRLWQHLRRRQLGGHRFRRQHPIAGAIADFCCIGRRLVVEVDGSVHRRRQEHDRERDENVEAAGYRVIRFTNDEVEHDLERVLAEIRAACEEAG